jgi:hypothetical protein
MARQEQLQLSPCALAVVDTGVVDDEKVSVLEPASQDSSLDKIEEINLTVQLSPEVNIEWVVGMAQVKQEHDGEGVTQGSTVSEVGANTTGTDVVVSEHRKQSVPHHRT